MKYVAIMFSLVLFFSSQIISNNNMLFIETSEGNAVTLNWQVTNLKTKQIQYTLNNRPEKITMIGKGASDSWSKESKTENITLTRKGNIVLAEGIRDGKKIDKEIKISDLDWMASPGFYLKDFIISKEQKKYIWLINTDSLKASKMVVTKVDEYERAFNEKQEKVIVVEMKPVGLKGLLWKASYHFISDGTYIYYKGLKGPPGTPEFVIKRMQAQ
ncbi:hypothetical protein DID75_01060 [Candidatus Marinamargulisbacteria bacterium SCGC AG-410-N11]|nr:hypothetical protein DID75_01060 [Candidatus Marinamargulisbacteria bacterium SCGC AG-410-N11]